MDTKSLISGILIGAIAIPTLGMAGSFTSSLIAGKTPAEAVEILATRIDTLIGRVEIVETKQTKTELWQEKEDACNKARDFLTENMPTGYKWFLDTISRRERGIMGTESQISLLICQGFVKEEEDCKIGEVNCKGKCITVEDRKNSQTYLETNAKPELSRLISIKEQYLLLKQKCDDLTDQYNSL